MWEIIFMVLVLKIPMIYVCWVVWWAIRAEPAVGSEGDEADHVNWTPWRRWNRNVLLPASSHLVASNGWGEKSSPRRTSVSHMLIG